MWGLQTDICLWKGGLVNANFKIWGLVSWKFSNLGACELKFGWKLRLLRLKFPNFLKRGLVNWLFCLKWNPCERQERREKGVFRAAQPHTPFLGQCPPLEPALSVRKGKVKETSQFLPFIPDFSSFFPIFPEFFQIFSDFSRFLAIFSLSGVALCPPCHASGYATGLNATTFSYHLPKTWVHLMRVL